MFIIIAFVMLSFVIVCFLQTDNASVFSGSITQVGSPVGSAMNLIPEDGLPPILISTGVKGGKGDKLIASFYTNQL